jgi:hypothetical protein
MVVKKMRLEEVYERDSFYIDNQHSRESFYMKDYMKQILMKKNVNEFNYYSIAIFDGEYSNKMAVI